MRRAACGGRAIAVALSLCNGNGAVEAYGAVKYSSSIFLGGIERREARAVCCTSPTNLAARARERERGREGERARERGREREGGRKREGGEREGGRKTERGSSSSP